MKSYLRLLIATDYSQVAKNAEQYAIRFSEEIHALPSWVHVYDTSFVSKEGQIRPEKTNEEAEKEELDKLAKHVEDLLAFLHAESLQYSCAVREGNVVKGVKQEAFTLDAHMIVVGMHGASELRDKVFGTNAWGVIQKSDLPVLSVSENAAYKKWKNIVFSTELRENEVPAISYLTQLAAKFNGEVTLLHVSNNVLTAEFEKKLFNDFMKLLKDKVSYPGLSVRLIHNDNIVEGINNFCGDYETDLLVMSHEKHFFIEKIFNPSISKKVMFKAHLPVLFIPDGYNPEDMVFWKIMQAD